MGKMLFNFFNFLGDVPRVPENPSERKSARQENPSLAHLVDGAASVGVVLLELDKDIVLASLRVV